MTDDKAKLYSSLMVPTAFLALLWIILIIDMSFNLHLVKYGLYPRKIWGLPGIITAPLIHAGVTHLLSNSAPLLVVGTGILYFYRHAAFKVFAIVYFVPGIFVWFWGRSAFHIGASGLIYGLVSYVFFSGIIRRDTRSIALALIVTLLYGGMMVGVIPQDDGISWEYHLFGSLTGIACAFIFRKSDPYKKYDWEEEESDTPANELEISYDKEPPF